MKHTIISSLSWKFLERGVTQGIQFVISIILARLLSPSDYGVLALILIFIAIANVFVQSGLNSSLIQKKVVDSVDISSVFYISLGIAGIFYCVLFASAPIIARFYENELLIPVIRVLALTLFPGAFNSIQNAIVSRTMRFKKLFFGSIGAGMLSGLVGIILAYEGVRGLGFSLSTIIQPSWYYSYLVVYSSLETDISIFIRTSEGAFLFLDGNYSYPHFLIQSIEI